MNMKECSWDNLMTKWNKFTMWNKPQPQIIKLSKWGYPFNFRSWYCLTSAAECIWGGLFEAFPFIQTTFLFSFSWLVAGLTVFSTVCLFSFFNIRTWRCYLGWIFYRFIPRTKCLVMQGGILLRNSAYWQQKVPTLPTPFLMDLFVLKQRCWSELMQRAGSVILNCLHSHPGDGI